MNPNQIDPTSRLGQILNQVGGYLAPMQAFSSQLPYDTYAAPQREVFNFWANNLFRPEFETNTLNPYKRNLSNQYAGSNVGLTGRSQSLYDQQLRQAEQPFQDQLSGLKNTWDTNVIRNLYNRQLTNAYDSPTAFNNIGG